MQPTFLPWSGYFNLAFLSDKFIFLDDVQFQRQSWQSRNRIVLNGVAHLIALPVKAAPLDTNINSIELVDDAVWRRKHLATLKHAYPSIFSGDLKFLGDRIHHIYHSECKYLAWFNIEIIKVFFDALDIRPEIYLSSNLGSGGVRSEYLSRLCHEVEADLYISPNGSMNYLKEDNFEVISGIPIRYQNFVVGNYPQRNSENFISHMSVLDVIAQRGLSFARQYIRGEGSNEN
jgi:hypothetical protein